MKDVPVARVLGDIQTENNSVMRKSLRDCVIGVLPSTGKTSLNFKPVQPQNSEP